MDFSVLKKRSSFRSIGSYKQLSKIDDPRHEPILSNKPMNSSPSPTHPNDVVLKIHDADEPVKGGKNIRRESSYDFWKGGEEGDGGKGSGGGADGGGGECFNFQQGKEDDPPSRLISQFLHKQRASGDVSLDFDLEMDELRQDRNLPPVEESPSKSRVSKDLKVSFHPPVSDVHEIESESVRRRFKDSSSSPGDTPEKEHQNHPRGSLGNGNAGGSDGRSGEVVRCTSNASFERKSTLMKTKAKSRLLDPPEGPDRRSSRLPPKSGQIKSGFARKTVEEEEEDPFMEEDLPDEYRKGNCDTLTLLQWVSLIVIIAALICTLCIPYLRDMNLWKLKLWKWEVMILVLICGRLVSGWGIRIIVFFIERNFLLRKRVLYFVYGLRKAVQNCLWLGLVLIAWHFLFDKKVEREAGTDSLNYVTKVLVCFLVGTLVWLLKTLLVKVLASSFHVSTYFDRIQESLFNQYVIETLSGPPLVEIKKTEEEEKMLADEVLKLQNAGVSIPPDLKATAFSQSPTKSGRVIGSGRKSPLGRSGNVSQTPSRKGEEGITIDHLHKLNPNNVSAWNMKRLINMVRHGTLSTLDEQILDSTHDDDESTTQIRSENEAKAAAKKIFQNVARERSRYIHIEDLLRFMREDEALKTMSLFEGATESNKISKSALKNWVVNAFRERRALALTLNDTKTAVNKLHRIINFIVGIIILVIWLLILGIATSKFLLFVSSQLVLAAFIFGNSCKTVFEAIIFLFVMHPFDVGDRCEIDGVQMVVEEMNILTSVFLRYDNQKIIYPNSVLATKPIHNYYRSPDMGDAVEFCVHIATPADKIALMKQRIVSYIDNKKEHWYPSPLFIFKDVEDLNRLRIAIWLTHKMNHQDMGERWVRRAVLVDELTKIFRELDIQYRLLPVNINVCSLPPLTSDRLPSNWTTTTN